MALKINWTQKKMTSPTKWALPPAFMVIFIFSIPRFSND